MEKDDPTTVLVKEYFGHNIEVRIHPASGKETVLIDGKQVSQKLNWFKLNYFHKFEINSGWAVKKGFVQIRTFLLDCVVVIKIVIDNKIIEAGYWQMPVQMSFRQIFIWVPTLALLGGGVVGLNKFYGTLGHSWMITLEILATVFLANYLSGIIAILWAEKAAEKMEKEMSDIPNPDR